MKLLPRLLRRPPVSPVERALRQRRRLVKLTGLVALSICGLIFLAFLFFVMPGRLSGGEISLIAVLGLMLFGPRLLNLMRRVSSPFRFFRWRR